MKEIKTVYYPKQCQAYYDALERGDGVAAHYLHLPPVYKRWEQIESEMRFAELVANFEAEQKRIEKNPNELLRFEIKMKLGREKPTPSRKSFWERIFG